MQGLVVNRKQVQDLNMHKLHHNVCRRKDELSACKQVLTNPHSTK